MDCRVLGAVEVVDGERPVALGGTKARLVLAVLLAHRDDVVPLDHLVDALWGPAAPATAPATLQTHVSRLRRVLMAGPDPPHLETRPPGYRLHVDPAALDATRFEDHLERARTRLASAPGDARDELDAAEREWRGAAFAGFADHEAVRAEAVRLDELRLVAQEVGADARLACGEHRELIGTLEALVAAHPLRERFRAQLMLALYRSGRPAEALARARGLREVLRDELGLDPGPDLRALEADILAERPALDWAPSAPVRTPVVAPSELVGRGEQLAFVARLLERGRLVTLTGPGGVGKTRLVHALLGRDGHDIGAARVVELAPVGDRDAVLAATAGALDLQRRPERSLDDSIVEVLAPLRLLLVLDNCEHVAAVVAPLVALILRRCPSVRVLATSREPLGLAVEITWSLPPLAVPASAEADAEGLVASPAVTLFTARATAARPGFTVDDHNRRHVAQICIGLDGLPLALELAAARIRSMTAADLAARLDERFRLLAGRRGGDPRHRALADVVAWSHDLLAPDERELFARLSVFAGAFDLQRAEEVCAGDGLGGIYVAVVLSALVDKSMVVAVERNGRMRYRLLETLRAFGRERLEVHGSPAVWRAAHARSYRDLARAAGRDLGSSREADGIRRCEESLDDLREAVRGSLARDDVDTALEIVVAVREFAFRTLRDEVFGWAEAAAAAPGAETHPLAPVARAVVAYGCFVRGALDPAVETAWAAATAAARRGTTTHALAERAMGNALFYRGATDAALRTMERMVAVAVASGEDAAVAHAEYMISVARTSVGDVAGARGAARRSRTAAARCGSPTALAQADFAEGLLCERTEPDRAVALLARSAERAGAVDNRWLRAFARTEELSVRANRGELGAAVDGFADVVDTWFRGGDWANQWLTLRHLFGVFVRLGDGEAAAVLHGAIETAGATTALPFEPADAARTAELVTAVRARLGEAAFDAAVARGRGMRDDEVVGTTLRHLAAARDAQRATRSAATSSSSPGTPAPS